MKPIYVLAIAIAVICIGTAGAVLPPIQPLSSFADYTTTVTDATTAWAAKVPASAWAWQTGTASATSKDPASTTVKAGYTDTDSGSAIAAVSQFKKDPSAAASDAADSISATNQGGFTITPTGVLSAPTLVDEGAASTMVNTLTTAQGMKDAIVLVAVAAQTTADEFAGASQSQSESFTGAEADF